MWQVKMRKGFMHNVCNWAMKHSENKWSRFLWETKSTKMKNDPIPQKFNSISDLHRVLGLPKPLHPLVSLVDNTRIAIDKDQLPASFLFNFYKISYKKGLR